MSFPTVVFDDGKGELAPLTDLRASFDLRTGMTTTLERLTGSLRLVALAVPESLERLTRERHALPVNDFSGVAPGPVLLVNGRSPLATAMVPALRVGEVLRDPGSGDIIAAVVDGPAAIKRLLSGDSAGLSPVQSPALADASIVPRPLLLSRPWHIRALRDPCLDADLAWHAPARLKTIASPELGAGVLRVGRDALVVPRSAEVFPSVVFDTTFGPIIVDQHAVIRPGAIICGPAYIGPHSHILDRCLIKPHTSIGPHCKIAGEVGGTIFQGFANKAHDGHLGDSYVGEWANLGAGTTNSNLLNTYAEVVCRASPDGPNERTGETFLGAIIGDHCKFAICTRIMTGAIVHTGTMWAATAPVSGCVAAFGWVTDAGTRPYALGKFIEVARTVMARRKLTMSDAYAERLMELHGLRSPFPERGS